MPIAFKLSLVIGTLMVAVIGLLAVLIVRYQQDVLLSQIDDLGKSLAEQMSHAAAEPLLADDRLALEVLTTQVAEDEAILGTAVLDRDGAILARAGLIPANLDRIPVHGLRPGNSWLQSLSDNRHLQVISYSRPIHVQGVLAGYALITLDHATWTATASNANQAIIGSSLAVLIIGVILTIWLSRRLSRPIQDLMSFSEAMHQGSYDMRFYENRRDELGHLMNALNRFAEDMQQKHQAERNLARYLSPQLAKAVLNEPQPVLGGQRVQASVLFADIVGFTGMAEGMRPEEVANLLNLYFAHLARATEHYGGMIDKYIGDCAMILFGVPNDDPEHAFNAVCCALAMRDLIERQNREREAMGFTPVRFRFGLNSGEMLAGNMGAEERMEYTVLGEAVNLASRLAGASEGGQILVSDSFYQRPEIRDRVIAREHRTIRLRGFSRPIRTWIIERLVGEHDGIHHQRMEQLWWKRLKERA